MDLTMLTAISTIAAEQVKAIKTTIKTVEQLLDYLATHPDATMHFQAFDTVLNIHSDSSYLSEHGAQSQVSGHFFIGWLPKKKHPIHLNTPSLPSAKSPKS